MKKSDVASCFKKVYIFHIIRHERTKLHIDLGLEVKGTGRNDRLPHPPRPSAFTYVRIKAHRPKQEAKSKTHETKWPTSE